jgi:anti-anti-sigma factor
VRLRGALDVRSATALARRLRSLLEQGSERLVLDLAKLERFDTSGLAQLARTFRRHRRRVRVALPALPREVPGDLARLARIFAGAAGVGAGAARG